MKYLIIIIRVNILLAFLFHSYIIMTPAIDELGFFRISLHAVLASVALLLFNLSRDLDKELKDEDK
jgi:hypothetical protein